MTLTLTLTPLPRDIGPGTRRAAERATALSLLRRLLDDDTLSIAHTPDGTPFIPSRPGLYLSVSHCVDSLAVALSADTPVGVDIERRTPRVARIASRIMRPDEPTGIDPLHAWTAKEAVFKCAGISSLVLSDIRILDNDVTRAVTPDGCTFAIHRPDDETAIAINIC